MVLDWQSYLETAQTQTHEGTIKTVVRQIVRKPTKIIAQSAEDAQTENEFELYLTLLEYLKQMEPCVRAARELYIKQLGNIVWLKLIHSSWLLE